MWLALGDGSRGDGGLGVWLPVRTRAYCCSAEDNCEPWRDRGGGWKDAVELLREPS